MNDETDNRFQHNNHKRNQSNSSDISPRGSTNLHHFKLGSNRSRTRHRAKIEKPLLFDSMTTDSGTEGQKRSKYSETSDRFNSINTESESLTKGFKRKFTLSDDNEVNRHKTFAILSAAKCQLEKLHLLDNESVFTKDINYKAGKTLLNDLEDNIDKIWGINDPLLLGSIIKISLIKQNVKCLDPVPITEFEYFSTLRSAEKPSLVWKSVVKYVSPEQKMTLELVTQMCCSIVEKQNKCKKTTSSLAKSFVKPLRTFKGKFIYFKTFRKIEDFIKEMIISKLEVANLNEKRHDLKNMGTKNKELKEFLVLKKLFFEYGCDEEEWIFRLSADTKQLESAKRKFAQGIIPEQKDCSRHCLASIIKIWLSNLSFVEKSSNKFSQKFHAKKKIMAKVKIPPNKDISNKKNLFGLIHQLSKRKRDVLESLLDLLKKVTEKSHLNKMTAKSLSLLISPVLFEFNSAISKEEIFFQISVLENMILFSPFMLAPPKHLKRKSKSPAISDISSSMPMEVSFDKKQTPNEAANGFESDKTENAEQDKSSPMEDEESRTRLRVAIPNPEYLNAATPMKGVEKIPEQKQNTPLRPEQKPEADLKTPTEISNEVIVEHPNEPKPAAHTEESQNTEDPNRKMANIIRSHLVKTSISKDTKPSHYKSPYPKIASPIKSPINSSPAVPTKRKKIDSEETHEKVLKLGTDLDLHTLQNMYWVEIKNDPLHAFKPMNLISMDVKGSYLRDISAPEKAPVFVKTGETFTKINLSQLKENVDNLEEMSEQSIPMVLYQLHKRFVSSKIYTLISNVLICVNPNEFFDIYSLATIHSYYDDFIDKLPPHIFQIAKRAHFCLMSGEDQSIVISGDSGSGKTEASKHCINYFTNIFGSLNSIETKINRNIPLLEAFGNAKTVLNNNSSRFGKYSKFLFDEKGRIYGAEIKSYLLEKNRVVLPQFNLQERNFHIFYQFIKSPKFDDLKKGFGLEPGEDYNYLGRKNVWDVENLDDIASFDEVVKAMSEIGFTKDDVFNMFRLISVILQIGNIDFNQNQEEINEKIIKVAKNLNIQKGMLEKNLFNKKIMVGRRDVIYSSFNLVQAKENRDNLSRLLYESLFSWVLEKTNKSLSAEEQPRTNSIGILDIFGFETFEHNSFEQLCINFTNEKLHEMFISAMFRDETALYEAEGIDFKKSNFSTNVQTITLFEHERGLFAMLEESSQLQSETDEKLVSKMNTNLAVFDRYRCNPKKHAFTVDHFSGKVEYDVTNFLSKNRNEIGEGLKDILHHSDWDFLHRIVDKSPFDTSIKRKQPLSKKFRIQLEGLVSDLKKTRTHYVKCLKSNSLNIPKRFEEPLVVKQLKNSGVFDMLETRKNGYPYKLSHADFCQRYSNLLNPNTIHATNSAEEAALINEQLGLNCQIGKTKVFYHDSDTKKLESVRSYKIFSHIEIIQKSIRSNLAALKLSTLLRHVRHLNSILEKEVLDENVIMDALINCLDSGLKETHYLFDQANDKIDRIEKRKELAKTTSKSEKMEDEEQPDLSMKSEHDIKETNLKDDVNLQKTVTNAMQDEVPQPDIFEQKPMSRSEQKKNRNKEKNKEMERKILEDLKYKGNVSNLKKKFENLHINK